MSGQRNGALREVECWADCAETPEAMRREIDAEPRLRMYRPGLLPGMGRDAEMDQRVFDAATLRREGLTFAEIGRHIGRCTEVVRNYCHWYVTGPDADAYQARWRNPASVSPSENRNNG